MLPLKSFRSKWLIETTVSKGPINIHEGFFVSITERITLSFYWNSVSIKLNGMAGCDVVVFVIEAAWED